MEFCPKCGSILVPQKVGRAKRLVCPRCGYKSKIKAPTTYKIREKGKKAEEITVIVEKKKKKKKEAPSGKEYELEPPEYSEEYFEGE
jgi:DNA-directed RNA polymerase subunit M/transcription elongation factor TFIIS